MRIGHVVSARFSFRAAALHPGSCSAESLHTGCDTQGNEASVGAGPPPAWIDLWTGGRLSPRDASLAVSSTLGEGLGLMMWINAPGTNSWLTNATTADTWGDPFVTTALTTNVTSAQMLNDLWPSIEAILDRSAARESIEMGWRSDRSIDEVVGDHLMTLAMWGSDSAWPARTESYFARVSTETAASVPGQVGCV
jgi:hypothetical protein